MKKKWNDIKVVIEYGMLSEDKFYEKADNFALYPTTEGEYFTFEELKESIKDLQTDKDDKLILLLCFRYRCPTQLYRASQK